MDELEKKLKASEKDRNESNSSGLARSTQLEKDLKETSDLLQQTTAQKSNLMNQMQTLQQSLETMEKKYKLAAESVG